MFALDLTIKCHPNFYLCKDYYSNNMKRISISVMLSIIFFSVSNSQTISGTITDAITKEVLIGANIVLDNGNGTSTNIDGEYQLQIQEGQQKITFKYLGYEDIIKTVTAQKNKNTLRRYWRNWHVRHSRTDE